MITHKDYATIHRQLGLLEGYGAALESTVGKAQSALYYTAVDLLAVLIDKYRPEEA